MIVHTTTRDINLPDPIDPNYRQGNAMTEKTNARDELAADIAAVTDLWDEPLDEVHDIPQIVNALKAKRYSKPRTVETVEELDSLPAGSVILDRDGDAWQMYRGGWNCTDRASNTVGQPSSSLVNVLGPAAVLYEPGAGE